MMTSKERLLKAINGEKPDRLPVTTHHLQKYFLDKCMDGIDNEEFFDRFKMDPIMWISPVKAKDNSKYFIQNEFVSADDMQFRPVSNDNWRIEQEKVPDDKYPTVRYSFITPKKELTMILQSNEYTSWVTEHLIKEKQDVDILAEYLPHSVCDVEKVNNAVDDYGQRGLVRGTILCFDLFGQPGVWQDAACLVGIEKLMMSTFDDPDWVHTLLNVLFERKKTFIESLSSAKFDILELGGGDASTTVISPDIFDKFVAPYDSKLIETAHKVDQKIAYHTCGGMMPILTNIASMKPDAMETFTPSAMGGDTDLKQAREKLPQDICMIGGFDQFHFFVNCTEEQIRKEVRRCFDAAGKNGSYILCPSDHFFEAEPELLFAFADEAKKCIY
jgi:hypothetical protein